MNSENICRVPVSATVKKINGEMQVVSAQWESIPADVIARLLIQKFGITPIFGGDDEVC